MSSPTLQYTPIDEIQKIHARLNATFKSGITRPLAYRRKQLLQLAHLIQDNIKEIEEATLADLGKQPLETTLTELAPVVSAALNAVEHLEEWTAPEKPKVEEWRKSWDTTIYMVPKGVILNISPWNYPFILTFNPLVGAIAAGCPAVLKPSESTPASSILITSLVAKYLDPNAYAVVNGGVAETTAVLNLRWNHIFFTGGTKIGKIVAAAAAKFVTPLTLELGGKSPVIVDADCDIKIAAKRALYGKAQNVGQLCVSPDYVLVPRSIATQFKEALKEAYHTLWPGDPLGPENKWGKIVNTSHHARVKNIITKTKGEVVLGGTIDGDRRIAPTIVTNVTFDDSLMADENFGPVLPIIEVEDVDEAIQIVADRPTPLVLYAFTNSKETKEKLISKTNSGTLCLNDTTTQLGVHEMPFGGQGDSGYGAYYGKITFDIFTHKRSFINVPPEFEPSFALRYPPYTEEAYKVLCQGAFAPIPSE